jgi:protein-L-isoaspartate(D-aspartate) O-methyltransferase
MTSSHPEGRFVVPLRWRGQARSVTFSHQEDHLRSDSSQLYGFIHMLSQDGERTGHIGTDGHVILHWDTGSPPRKRGIIGPPTSLVCS